MDKSRLKELTEISQNAPEKAVLLIEQEIRSNHDNPDLWLLMGECIERLGDNKLAIETLQFGARQCNDGRLWFSLARLYEKSNDEAASRRALCRAVKHGESDLGLLKEIARRYYDAGKFVDAMETCIQAVNIDATDERLLALLTASCVKINKSGIAMPFWYEKISRARDPDLLVNISAALIQTGDDDKIGIAFRRLERLWPNLQEAAINKTIYALTKGNFLAAGIYAENIVLSDQTAVFDVAFPALALSMRDRKALLWARSLPGDDGRFYTSLIQHRLVIDIRRLFSSATLDKEDLLRLAKELHATTDDSFATRVIWYFLPHLFARFRGEVDQQTLLSLFPPNNFVKLLASSVIPGTTLLESMHATLDFARKDYRWTHFIFNSYVVPAIKAALDRNNPFQAMLLCASCYQMLQNPPVAAHHAAFLSTIEPIFTEWAEAQQNKAGKVWHRFAAPPSSGGLNIVYVTDHYMHRESPDAVLLSLLDGISRVESNTNCHIIASVGASDAVEQKIESYAARLTRIALIDRGERYGPDAIHNFADKLRIELDRLRADILVFFGTTDAFCLAVAPLLGNRPKIYYTVWHEHMYSPYLTGAMSHLLPVGYEITRINQTLWFRFAGALSFPEPTPQQIAEADKIKGDLIKRHGQDTIVLGSITRAAKLSSSFLDTLALILKARPNAIFLWTGFTHERYVQSKIESLGIAQRCHYVGYVDPAVYCQVLDIHLDPFPFANGHTMWRTWQRGGAYVTMASRYRDIDGTEQVGYLSMVSTLVEPILSLPAHDPARVAAISILGPELDNVSYATSCADYARQTIRLIDHVGDRERIGQAASAFMREFTSNTERAAINHLKGLRFFIDKHRQNDSPN